MVGVETETGSLRVQLQLWTLLARFELDIGAAILLVADVSETDLVLHFLLRLVLLSLRDKLMDLACLLLGLVYLVV